MAEAGEILQLKIETGRVAQLGDRRWIQRKNNGVLDRSEFSSRAGNHRLNGVFSAFAFAPIFEPPERKRRVLAASVETKTGDRDEAFDFRLLQK